MAAHFSRGHIALKEIATKEALLAVNFFKPIMAAHYQGAISVAARKSYRLA